MAEEEKKVDITNFEEGVEYLAKNLKFFPPIPEDDMVRRRMMVISFIGTLSRQ